MNQDQDIVPSIGSIIGFLSLAFIILGIIMAISIMRIHFSKTQETTATSLDQSQLSGSDMLIRKQKFAQEVTSAQNSLLAGDYNGELRHGQQALQYADTNTQKANAHYWMANGYLDLNNVKQADAEAQIAVQLDPTYANAYSTLALAKLDESDLPSAYADAAKALQLKPSAEHHNILGLVLQAQGKKDEAVQEFQTAVNLDPQNTLFRENLLHAK